ncbi:DUF6146 family protein [Flavobacterium sp. RSB2_4_14]|uniref:DUF6146 family protein n=1 Tax=Flavobacterium sp. RSB2_4_14 TaxID=3447665 RepID=UPI003F40A4C7
MRKIILAGLFITLLIACSSTKSVSATNGKNLVTKTSDTIKIANDSLEYEIMIIDPGFNPWLASYAKPRGFYSESYLENKNRIYVIEWNSRVNQPQRYSRNLYEMRIDYEPFTHYGYEVNYLLYNYFIYFQITNKQQLAGFVPSP